MIRAVIFDMDGLLIDSEPLWHKAEIAVFGRLGVHLDTSKCLQTAGLRVDEVVEHWHRQHPWEMPEKKRVEHQIIDEVVALIKAHGEPKAGVRNAIEYSKSMNVKIALASSSSYRIIEAVTEKLDLGGVFDVVYSAEEEKYGKPHPAVYLSTAERLGTVPVDCMAIEDSINGVLAAKAARMRCVAVPETLIGRDQRFVIADLVLDSLADFDRKVWERIESLWFTVNRRS